MQLILDKACWRGALDNNNAQRVCWSTVVEGTPSFLPSRGLGWQQA